MLLLRGFFDAERSADLTATYLLRSGSDRITVRVLGGQIEALRGEATERDAVLDVGPSTFYRLVTGAQTLDQARARGDLTLVGDHHKVQRLLAAVPVPGGPT
jgi:hypothetical protein